MKKKTSLFLLSLTLVLTVLLSACGQSQTNVPPSENDSAANTSAADTNTPVDEPKSLEDSQPATADVPTETNLPAKVDAPAETNTLTETDALTGSDSPTEGTNDGAGESDSGASNTTENRPETNVAAPEKTTPVSTPESGEALTPAFGSESDTSPVTSLDSDTQSPVSTQETPSVTETEPVETPASNTALSGTTLTLRFGGGESFTINMYDNDTANKIAEYVGTASWNLPIYHFDDYDGWESFQYYDIPSRYDIPDGSESVTSEKAGAVYYSHPNRIILFYQDAEISTEYTPVGYIDFSQDLVDAVENNPVVQGWGNKLVFIQP